MRSGRLEIAKGPTELNVSDLLTRSLSREVMVRHVRSMGLEEYVQDVVGEVARYEQKKKKDVKGFPEIARGMKGCLLGLTVLMDGWVSGEATMDIVGCEFEPFFICVWAAVMYCYDAFWHATLWSIVLWYIILLYTEVTERRRDLCKARNEHMRRVRAEEACANVQVSC